MAEVRPLEALHYNRSAISSLADVTAPPYDVVDSKLRAELLSRSPLNVVEIDLPQAPAGRDPYEHAAETLEAWVVQGVLSADRESAIWALTQDFEGPDGSRRTVPKRVAGQNHGPHYENEQPSQNSEIAHSRTSTILRITKWAATSATRHTSTISRPVGVSSRISR